MTPGERRRALRASGRDAVVLAVGLFIEAVVVIALPALGRKFVMPDSGTTPAPTIGAPGLATPASGLGFWLLRARASNDAA